MTKEDKELLLRDLCARLPYENIIGKCELDVSYDTSFDTIFQTHKFDAVVYGIKEGLLFVYPLIEDRDEQEFANEEVFSGIDILDFKPYLFPLSSMTREQLFEVQEILGKNEIKIEDGFLYIIDSDRNTITYLEILALLNWFYKNHFDINGLISMDLAIDASELNIYKTSISNNPQITIGTKICLKSNPDEILTIISDDCHEDKFECSDGSVLSLKQIKKYYDII